MAVLKEPGPREGPEVLGGVVWSPGGSLALSDSQSAGEKKGLLGSSPSPVSSSLSEETPICVTPLGEVGIKIDGALPMCRILGQALPPT